MDGPDNYHQGVGRNFDYTKDCEEPAPRKSLRMNSDIKFEPAVLPTTRSITSIRQEIWSTTLRTVWDRVDNFKVPGKVDLKVATTSDYIISSFEIEYSDELEKMNSEELASKILGIVKLLTESIADVFVKMGENLLQERQKMVEQGTLSQRFLPMVVDAKYFLGIARAIAPDKYVEYKIEIVE